MTFSRKGFLAGAAVAASAAALQPAGAAAQERSPSQLTLLKAGQFDPAAMLQVLETSGEHKQVFQSVDPYVSANAASIYEHMQNSMNAYQFSLGLGHLSTLAVFLGYSVFFALDDAMWTKYGVKTAAPKFDLAATNVYYRATSPLDPNADPDDPHGMYQDWSAQAVIARGGRFFVCHNALNGAAASAAKRRGTNAPAVLADFKQHMLAGFQIVPAGVAAIQQAQEHGWKPFPII